MGLERVRSVTLPGSEPARQTDRNILGRIFCTSQSSLSFGGLTTDMKDAIVASNLAAMSDVEIIAVSVVVRRPVVIKTELTTYVKERHDHSRNYVVHLCLIIGGPETGWGACAHWGMFHM